MQIEKQTQTEKEPEPQVHARIVLPDSQYFKKLCQFLENIVSDEVTFNVDMYGLRVQQMEPSRVALTILTIPKEACEEFDCVTPGTFTINIERLRSRVLKRVNKHEKVQLFIKDNNVEITLLHRLRRVFNLPVLEPSDVESPTPKLKPGQNAFKVVLKNFKELLEDVAGGHVHIIMTPESVTFRDSADDYHAEPFRCTLERGSDSLLDIGCGQPGELSCFSASYLQEFTKHTMPLADILACEYTHEMPMKITLALEFGISLQFWLAPRISSD